MEIHGQIVASLLPTTAHREISERWAVVLDFLIGIIVGLVGLFGRRVQVAAVVTAMLLSGFLSLYLFRQYCLFLSFVPICIGIFVHLYLEKGLHLGASPATH